MSDAYFGEIRMFAGTYAPVGWALCDGSLLPIQTYDALFSLLGTQYGGDGVTNFALPDLRGRIPISKGSMPGGTTYYIGGRGGVEQVVLGTDQIAPHTHLINAQSGTGQAARPDNGLWANSGVLQYAATDPNSVMSGGAVSATGGNQAHDNMMPHLTVNFIICLDGYYPVRD